MFKKKEFLKASIGNCTICKEVAEFFVNNGVDIHNFPDSFYTNMLDKDEFYKKCGSMGFMGNSNDVYEKSIIFNNPVAFENLIGVHTCLDVFLYYYNRETGYSERHLDHLSRDIMENIKYIKSLEFGIEVAELEAKYYILDGNHRVAYLLIAYLILKEKYKNDKKKFSVIACEFYISVKIRNKVDVL